MQTYGDYLRLDQLLDQQLPNSDPAEHDEMLFIVVHQVYELWFKVMLHELDKVCVNLRAGESAAALHTLRRVRTILKTLVTQLDVVETITPLGFLSFRDRLDNASGFQSAQFRELEFLLGKKNPEVLHRFADNSKALAGLERRLAEPSLWDAFVAHLAAKGFSVPAALLERDVTRPTEPSSEIQTLLIDVYHNHQVTTQICENLVDVDEGLQEWRYRHVMMVQRTIGTKPGTGGSAGADYLRSTLFRPAFPDLWAIRSKL